MLAIGSRGTVFMIRCAAMPQVRSQNMHRWIGSFLYS